MEAEPRTFLNLQKCSENQASATSINDTSAAYFSLQDCSGERQCGVVITIPPANGSNLTITESKPLNPLRICFLSCQVKRMIICLGRLSQSYTSAHQHLNGLGTEKSYFDSIFIIILLMLQHPPCHLHCCHASIFKTASNDHVPILEMQGKERMLPALDRMNTIYLLART